VCLLPCSRSCNGFWDPDPCDDPTCVPTLGVPSLDAPRLTAKRTHRQITSHVRSPSTCASNTTIAWTVGPSWTSICQPSGARHAASRPRAARPSREDVTEVEVTKEDVTKRTLRRGRYEEDVTNRTLQRGRNEKGRNEKGRYERGRYKEDVTKRTLQRGRYKEDVTHRPHVTPARHGQDPRPSSANFVFFTLIYIYLFAIFSLLFHDPDEQVAATYRYSPVFTATYRCALLLLRTATRCYGVHVSVRRLRVLRMRQQARGVRTRVHNTRAWTAPLLLTPPPTTRRHGSRKRSMIAS
jgi:hypothetical protein